MKSGGERCLECDLGSGRSQRPQKLELELEVVEIEAKLNSPKYQIRLNECDCVIHLWLGTILIS